MSDSANYAQLTDALIRLGYSQDAAEYHGALCGALCVKSAGEVDPLNLLVKHPAVADAGEAERTLRALCGQSSAALQSSDMEFGPMLPEDEAELPVRVRALSSWCEGFLFGLSTGRPLNMKTCSPELKEIVRDFTEFTHADMDEGEDQEVEETAYAELVEYVRVGAQLIYLELRQTTGATVH